MGNFVDMSGWKMWEHGVPDSRIIVLKRAKDKRYENGRRVVKWECRCSCGKSNTIIVSGISLRTGKTKSCGCLQKEITSNRSFIDLTGQKFNHLTVIKRVEDYMMKNGKRKKQDNHHRSWKRYGRYYCKSLYLSVRTWNQCIGYFADNCIGIF